MIDWLEELLEESREESEAEAVLRWGYAVYGLSSGAGRQEDAASPGQGEAGAQSLPEWDAEQALRGAVFPDSWGRGGGTAQGVEETPVETSRPGGKAWLWLDPVRAAAAPEQRTDGLYRRLARVGRGAEVSLPAPRTTAMEHQSTGTPSFTVDELDRAVRRDSRRYDGGMELY